MRFLSIYKTAERNGPPSVEHVTAMQRLIEEMTKAGTLIATEGCLPTALGARVRQAGGQQTVTDGPFTEAKEVIGGYAIYDVASKTEAIDWTRRFLEAHIGLWDQELEVEIRQMMDGDPSQGC